MWPSGLAHWTTRRSSPGPGVQFSTACAPVNSTSPRTVGRAPEGLATHLALMEAGEEGRDLWRYAVTDRRLPYRPRKRMRRHSIAAANTGLSLATAPEFMLAAMDNGERLKRSSWAMRGAHVRSRSSIRPIGKARRKCSGSWPSFWTTAQHCTGSGPAHVRSRVTNHQFADACARTAPFGGHSIDARRLVTRVTSALGAP